MNPEFNAVANQYDDTFSFTRVGMAMRRRVRSLVTGIKPGLRVLELNCGTGEDAVWMAQQGAQVVATDLSDAMIDVVLEKAARTGQSNQITARVCGFDALDQLDETNFDFVFSNFGGLNCIPAEAVRELSRNIYEKTAPNARLFLVVMSRFCWWESSYFLLKGRWQDAFRRFSRAAVVARLDPETTVQTWYYGPESLARLFPEFEPESCSPVGFWIPPSYLDPFFSRFPGALKVLEWLERHATWRFMAGCSDHYALVLRRKQSVH